MHTRESRKLETYLERLESLERKGLNPYPHQWPRTHTLSEVRESFVYLRPDETSDFPVRIAGRAVSERQMGRIAFVDLEDELGRLQVVLDKRSLGDRYDLLLDHLDLGDHLGIEGVAMRTQRGELSILASGYQFLSKCLMKFLPKRRSLSSAMQRDQRHLHLISDCQARLLIRTRSRVMRELRTYLDREEFIEVETPVLSHAYGGADANPFATHCKALDRNVFLRISPELDLKRYIIGGHERVYEINKQFRNEGIDSRHHPEFTSIEIYQAYADYHDMAVLTEQLISSIARNVCGSVEIVSRLGEREVEINLQPPFRRLTLLGAIEEFAGWNLANADLEKIQKASVSLGIQLSDTEDWGTALLHIFEETVERKLIQPTFILDYPTSVSPLTKRHRRNPRLAERFELFIHGWEFANAYSELTDPRAQKRNFDVQMERAELHGTRIAPPDYGFVDALRMGMPPTGGLGIGVDRLVMLLTGKEHIQDVIAFPLRATERKQGRDY